MGQIEHEGCSRRLLVDEIDDHDATQAVQDSGATRLENLSAVARRELGVTGPVEVSADLLADRKILYLDRCEPIAEQSQLTHGLRTFDWRVATLIDNVDLLVHSCPETA